MADPQLIASALLFRIFIDKFNVSGIELMILDLAVAVKWVPGNLLAKIAPVEELIIFIVEGRTRLETPPKES